MDVYVRRPVENMWTQAGMDIMLSQWDKQPDLRQRKKDKQTKWRPESESNSKKTDNSLSETLLQYKNKGEMERDREMKKRDQLNKPSRRKKINEKKERGRDRETSFKQTTTSPKRQYMSFLSVVSVFVSLK